MKMCTHNLAIDDQLSIFTRFWDMGVKIEQDIFLTSCLERVSRKTMYIHPTKNREHVWKYSVLDGSGKKLSVCRKLLLNLLQISEKRLRTVQNKLVSGNTLDDKRGAHLNRPHTISHEIWELALEHLLSLPQQNISLLSCKNKAKIFRQFGFDSTEVVPVI